MYSSTRTYESGELIAKQNAKRLIIIAISPLIGLAVIAFNYNKTVNKNPWGFVILTSILSVLTIYFWYKILDTGIKLIINKDGIWSKKYKLVPWDEIEAYHFEKRNGKTVGYIFWIETQTIGKSLKLEITFLDKDYVEISRAIEFNSKGFEIRYSGITEDND